MSTRFIAKHSSAASTRTGSHAGIGVDSDDNRLYVNADGTARAVNYCGHAKTVAATATLTSADSGATIFLSHATEFAVTLPALAAGLHFKFIVANAPESADYTVVTASAANNLLGQVYCSAGTDEDSETSGADTLSFVGGTSVLGDSADFFCDGTNWFVRAFCNATGGITITTAA
jgi:hypothetical protein